MKYSTTMIAVKNVNRARRFYEDIFLEKLLNG